MRINLLTDFYLRLLFIVSMLLIISSLRFIKTLAWDYSRGIYWDLIFHYLAIYYQNYRSLRGDKPNYQIESEM